MKNIMEWMLEKLRLTEDESNEEYLEDDFEEKQDNYYERTRFEIGHKKRKRESESEEEIFYKMVQTYDDCKTVLDKYKQGTTCVYSINVNEMKEAQELMNYICGGIYTLEGEVSAAGENVFWISNKKERN